MSTPANPEDPWARLRQFTRARIAIGRTGHAQKTASILAFGLAHAQARDAVHLALDVAALETALRDAGLDALHVLQAHGAAASTRARTASRLTMSAIAHIPQPGSQPLPQS